jgi:hypothetical protein
MVSDAAQTLQNMPTMPISHLFEDQYLQRIREEDYSGALALLSDTALDEIDKLLSTPHRGTSAAMFRLDPRWDALRGNPRFHNLVSTP